MFSIDSYAYKNKLTNVHPIEKILFAISTMVICLVSSSVYVYFSVILMMSCLTVFKAKISGKFYFRLLLVPSSFLLIGIASIAVIDLNTATGSIFSMKIFGNLYGITFQSLTYAFTIFLKSLGSVSCLYFLSLTTPLVDIVSVMRKLKVPEIFLELMSLIYRLIFILIDIIANIYTSQSSRLGYTTTRNQYKSLGYLVSSLLTLSYKKTNSLFTALESRCYTGELNVLEKNYKFCKKNIVYIVLVESILLLIVVISRLIK